MPLLGAKALCAHVPYPTKSNEENQMRKKMRLRPVASSLLALSLFMGASAPAFAEETKFTVKGDTDIAFNWTDNRGLNDKGKGEDSFFANQRIRLFLTARTSESTKFFTLLRIRPHMWGDTKNGYGLDADGVNMRMRQMYLDWQEPGNPLHLRVGIVPIVMPESAFHNSVLFSSVAGAVAEYAFNDTFGAKLGLYRPYDDYSADSDNALPGTGNNLNDEMDMAFFSLPMNFAEPKIAFEPWGLYAHIGKDSSFWRERATPVNSGPIGVTDRIKGGLKTVEDDGTGWWGGFAGKVGYFEDFDIKFDFAYGSVKSSDTGQNFNTRGGYADLAVDYKQPWGTPGFFGWYATGSDYDDVHDKNTWGYIPTISAFDEQFNPTSFGFGGGSNLVQDSAVTRQASGHWGIGAQVKDITFVPGLSHLVRFAYYQGTNDRKLADDQRTRAVTSPGGNDNTFLTTRDSVFEVNFNHQYPIYENLVLNIDTGYLHLNRGSEWKDDSSQNAWQFATNLKYSF